MKFALPLCPLWDYSSIAVFILPHSHRPSDIANELVQKSLNDEMVKSVSRCNEALSSDGYVTIVYPSSFFLISPSFLSLLISLFFSLSLSVFLSPLWNVHIFQLKRIVAWWVLCLIFFFVLLALGLSIYPPNSLIRAANLSTMALLSPESERFAKTNLSVGISLVTVKISVRKNHFEGNGMLMTTLKGVAQANLENWRHNGGIKGFTSSHGLKNYLALP